MKKRKEYRVKCFWGERAKWAEEQTPEVLEKSKRGYGIELYEFDTKGEVQAFIKGVDAGNGWNSFFIHELQ